MSAADSQLYARSFADVYDEWYGDLDDPIELVQALRQRCHDQASVLELGSGTGRLSSPLHAAGYRVIALDASAAMLVAAPPGPAAVAADMAALPLANNSVDAVIVAYNTFLNLAGVEQQQACFDQIGRVLRSGGVVAIEAFVADQLADASFGISTRDDGDVPGRRIAIITGPADDDPDVLIGSHIELGPPVVCRPWRLRYRSPTDLDSLATSAGLSLRERLGDWAGSPFTNESKRHVSWYESR